MSAFIFKNQPIKLSFS